jgi:hypothetical protein
MKRFTDTEKWSDPWYRKLPTVYKSFWAYICDKCDNSGVWKPDFEMAGFCIGEVLKEDEILSVFKERIEILPNGAWWIKKFISFQFGALNPACRPHQSVLELLRCHDIDYPNPIERVSIPLKTRQGQDKDKDKGECEGGRQWQPSEIQKRFNQLFNRKDQTRWADKEVKSLKALGDIPEEDLKIVETYYRMQFPEGKDYRRRDLQTLLNNFRGEVDRARKETAHNEHQRQKHNWGGLDRNAGTYNEHSKTDYENAPNFLRPTKTLPSLPNSEGPTT